MGVFDLDRLDSIWKGAPPHTSTRRSEANTQHDELQHRRSRGVDLKDKKKQKHDCGNAHQGLRAIRSDGNRWDWLHDCTFGNVSKGNLALTIIDAINVIL